MKIRIAMCDDDKNALPVIAGATESAFRARNIQSDIYRYSSGAALLEGMKRNDFQLILLDIDMPGLDGIEIGKAIREKSRDLPIVYVSECESRVFESFAVQPLGFVRKSNFLNDISATADLYLKTCAQAESHETLEFTTRTSVTSVRISNLEYIEGSRNYQMLYLADKEEPMEVKMTMERLEAMTSPFGFIRIHKGFLVNYHYIQRILPQQVILQDGKSLPIGRSKQGDVKAQYLSLIGK